MTQRTVEGSRRDMKGRSGTSFWRHLLCDLHFQSRQHWPSAACGEVPEMEMSLLGSWGLAAALRFGGSAFGAWHEVTASSRYVGVAHFTASSFTSLQLIFLTGTLKPKGLFACLQLSMGLSVVPVRD